MAPEQVQGETHRLDGRTDIWGLGVILYLGLLGRPPFSGRNRSELFDEIIHRDPKPPRQVNDGVSHELERICLKCLSKRMADRQETAGDLADDLKRWLVTEASTETSASTPHPSGPLIIPASTARIVPKGLRAFDLEDADFFFALLPGPRDRDGIPESIRAWKRRIEERDPERTSPVCMLYGPSGSGKSSLVKAGLLPHLASYIRPVYIEASAHGTETRLLAALSPPLPELPASQRLDEAVAAIREHRVLEKGQKVLLVLDQFEQWLHSHPDDSASELVCALRQCDGVAIQALLLVRDDFWMAIMRFLKTLEVPLIEGVNSSAVELFDVHHAKCVLAELGRAHGGFPADQSAGAQPEHERFLDWAVKELAGPAGRVIPVRLTLFAEMLRHRDWSTATLRELGGIEGIGVTFLEETFSARTAPPAHRFHVRAAQAVLKALLPESSSDLKGRLRPASMLQQAAGYADRPSDFNELIHILDNELRMVTPIDTLAVEVEGEAASVPEEPCYQLTHDYLVPPLRQWLTRKQRETRRGRAELTLAANAALWRNRSAPRRIPSLFEWLTIFAFTRHGDWSPDERAMMSAAARYHTARTAAAVAIAAAIGWGIFVIRRRERAETMLTHALNADYQRIQGLVPQLDAQSDLLLPSLKRIETSESHFAHERDVAEILLYRDRPTIERAAYLRARLLVAQPDELRVIRDALALHPERAGLDELKKVVLDDSVEPGARLRVACAAKLRWLCPHRRAGMHWRRPFAKPCLPRTAGCCCAGSNCSDRLRRH